MGTALATHLKYSVPWIALGAAVVIPSAVALSSPLLEWRDPVYITAGFAGVVAMALLLVQPLLVGGYLPGMRSLRGRRMHRWVGVGLFSTVVVHVGALWITSPPDVIDALLFRSPTTFSLWGVVAMWAVFAAALLASFRRRLRFSQRLWRTAHTALAIVVVSTSVVHALLIDGTMGNLSKAVLCVLAIVATAKVAIDLRCWTGAR